MSKTEAPRHPGRLGSKVLSRSLKLSPSESHIFKIIAQELCPSDGTSHWTAAVPAQVPGAAGLSLSPTTFKHPRILGFRVEGRGLRV